MEMFSAGRGSLKEPLLSQELWTESCGKVMNMRYLLHIIVYLLLEKRASIQYLLLEKRARITLCLIAILFIKE